MVVAESQKLPLLKILTSIKTRDWSLKNGTVWSNNLWLWFVRQSRCFAVQPGAEIFGRGWSGTIYLIEHYAPMANHAVWEE